MSIKKTELSGRELRAYEYLYGLHWQMQKCEDVLEERLRGTETWKPLRQAMGLIDKVIAELQHSFDDEMLQYILRMAEKTEIVMRPKFVSRGPDAQLVEGKDVQVIVDKVLFDNCAICLCDAKQARRCKIRRALMHICPSDGKPDMNGCAYREIATSNKFGEYLGNE